MDTLPITLAESLPSELLDDAKAWWTTLNEADRAELQRLCDGRKSLFLFETFSEADTAVKPKITGGKFIPGANEFGIEDWGEDYFQHLLDHPELMIVHDPTRRTFHIGCSRHIDARRCFVDGYVSRSFTCPFGTESCLMHRLLQDRDKVNLRPQRRLILRVESGVESGAIEQANEQIHSSLATLLTS